MINDTLEMLSRCARGQGYREGEDRAVVSGCPVPENLAPTLADTPPVLLPSDVGIEGHRAFEMQMTAGVWE